jgi:hypothetical protein
MRRAAVLALPAVLLAGFSVAASAPRELPLRGKTDRGQEWRLRAARPPADEDAPSSWCLKLDYTTGVVIDGDKYAGGLTTCGRRPARRISGVIAADCEAGSVFVFGAVRRGVHDVRLRNRRGLRRNPTFASLPPHSGFRGRTFIVVIDTRQLPAWLTAEGVSENPITRIPRQSQLCQPYPGAPAGGDPFADFESRQ